jgi:hypothetical protein
MAKQGSLFRLTVTIVTVLLILIYIIFNSRLIIKGPVIEIFDLRDGQVFENDGLVEIKGSAKNISYISLNDRAIFIDENHNFKENFLMTNEINTVEIYAKDKFGKETRKRLTLVYKGTPTEINIASSTEEILEMIEATSTGTSSEENRDIEI